jgi:hypothetical protein
LNPCFSLEKAENMVEAAAPKRAIPGVVAKISKIKL